MMGITEEVAPLPVKRMEIGAIHLFHHVTQVSSLQLSLINSLKHTFLYHSTMFSGTKFH